MSLVEGLEEIVFRYGMDEEEGGETSLKKYLDFFWRVRIKQLTCMPQN
jgi:hypothetical protein